MSRNSEKNLSKSVRKMTKLIGKLQIFSKFQKIFNPLIPKDFFGIEWKANSFKTFSRVNQICDSKRTFLHTNKLHLSIARFCLINCEVLYTIHVTGISLNYACVNFSPVLQHRFIEIGNKMVAKFYEILINVEKQNFDSEEWVWFW